MTMNNGLYRTTMPLPGQEKALPANRLVFVTTSTQNNKPAVVLPKGVKGNQWLFQERGLIVNDEAWLDTLVALPKQGFYVVTKEIAANGGAKLPPSLLVQLGFSQHGQPVVFPGSFVAGEPDASGAMPVVAASIVFSKNGLLISDLQLDNLEVAEFKLAAPQPAPAAPAPVH